MSSAGPSVGRVRSEAGRETVKRDDLDPISIAVWPGQMVSFAQESSGTSAASSLDSGHSRRTSWKNR